MTSRYLPTDPRWQIIARKYDQRVHYTLHADLVNDDGERLLDALFPTFRTTPK